MWNHRLFLLTGQARYIDVMEQTLYNGLLAGKALRGDEYFYVNPLESDGSYAFNHGSAGRQSWFDVSCCPTGMSRFFPSLPGYVYAAAGNTVYANLFIAGTAAVETAEGSIGITQETDYPWTGSVRFTLHPERPVRLRFMVRIPGWAREQIMGGHLYRFERPAITTPTLSLNGVPVDIGVASGYAVIDRVWKTGDSLELTLPLPVRKVLCDDRVSDNRGKAALQRGPLVYCIEGRDARVPLDAILLGQESELEARPLPQLLGGIVGIRGEDFTAIPYYAWANRGPGPMRVWLRNAGAGDTH